MAAFAFLRERVRIYGDLLPRAEQRLREALADTNHPEHEEFRMWLGVDDGAAFDPSRFDLGEVNRALREIGIEPASVSDER